MDGDRIGRQRTARALPLQNIIAALEVQTIIASSYLDRHTGEIRTISDEAFHLAECDSGSAGMIPDWQAEEVEWARQTADTTRYVALPTFWDMHGWDMMRRFCWSIPAEQTRANVLAAVKRRGAFRHFKDRLAQHDLWGAWNAFRRQALRTQAIEWCHANDVAFVA